MTVPSVKHRLHEEEVFSSLKKVLACCEASGKPDNSGVPKKHGWPKDTRRYLLGVPTA